MRTLSTSISKSDQPFRNFRMPSPRDPMEEEEEAREEAKEGEDRREGSRMCRCLRGLIRWAVSSSSVRRRIKSGTTTPAQQARGEKRSRKKEANTNEGTRQSARTTGSPLTKPLPPIPNPLLLVPTKPTVVSLTVPSCLTIHRLSSIQGMRPPLDEGEAGRHREASLASSRSCGT